MSITLISINILFLIGWIETWQLLVYTARLSD